MAAFNPAWVIEGISVLAELARALKDKEVDKKDLRGVGEKLQDLIASIRAARKGK